MCVLVVQNTKKEPTLSAVITTNVVSTVVKWWVGPPAPKVSSDLGLFTLES
jgi:hypothetical protein